MSAGLAADALLALVTPVAWQLAWLTPALWLIDTLCRRARVWTRVRAALWSCVALRLALPLPLGSPLSLASLLPATETARDAAVATHAGDAGVPAHAAPWLLAIWAAGAIALGLSWIARQRHATRSLLHDPSLAPAPAELVALAARAARRAGLSATPRVWVSDRAPGPLVIGLLRPALLMPRADVAHRPARQLEHALLHECCHLRRHDGWRAAFATALVVLWWFHPLAWLVRARLDELAELRCDAAVATRLRDAITGYRATLLRWGAARAGIAPPALGWLGGGAGLLARVDALDREEWRHPWRARGAAVVVTAAMLLCVLPASSAARSPQPDHLDPRSPRVADSQPPGCLPLRFTVLAALAEHRRAVELADG